MVEFISKHKLEFKTFPHSSGDPNALGFKIGTVEGVFETYPQRYIITDIKNHNSGNGQHNDFLNWFEFLCKKDNKNLEFSIVKPFYKKHLMEKHGFSNHKGNDLIKYYRKYSHITMETKR